MIIGVAVKRENDDILSLPKPARHCNLSAKYNEEARKLGWDFPWQGWHYKGILDGEQGFINDKGIFLSREDAAIEAFNCGQIKEQKESLFSEDIW